MRRQAAFTLIELLAVMTIILVLAGLILSIAGFAQSKGAKARAEGEIQAMTTGLESYKTDNGAYPESTDSDALNAQSDIDPGGASSTKYQKAGETLYQALAGVVPSPAPSGATAGSSTNADGTRVKAYYAFTPGQLGPTSTTLPSTAAAQLTTYVVDPFGLTYGYSTIRYAVNQGSPAPAASPGFNPTYDLWSTGGYGTGGKSYPTAAPTPTPNTLWIKNW